MGKLAILGGAPVRNQSWPAWPVFEQDEVYAATLVLQTGKVNYWTGQECKKFESEYAAQTLRQHAIALANGTLALELALIGHQIGPSDEVIVPSWTFIATASCVVMRGATPVIADIDPLTFGLSAETIRAKLSSKTKAIIVVHLAGVPCDMDPIMSLAAEHGLVVIEDCAQAHGASYKGQPVGSIGHSAAFSFCQDKIITTAGEGGMFLTNDALVWRRAWAYKDHGKSFDAVHASQHPPGFRWLHESFGTNWRMTEIQASIGRLQLKKLDAWVTKRKANAELLREGFKLLTGIQASDLPEWADASFYKLYASLDLARLKPDWTRDRIADAVSAEGVPCGGGSCGEIYREKAFTTSELQSIDPLPEAKFQWAKNLMFQVHPTLGPQEMQDTCCAVQKVLAEALR